MKRIILLLFLAAPALVLASPVDLAEPESAGMSSAQLERLKAQLQKELDNEVTGGMQVLIARRGKVVMHENLGHANVEENEPITDETLFRIYSMTKPIVSTARPRAGAARRVRPVACAGAAARARATPPAQPAPARQAPPRQRARLRPPILRLPPRRRPRAAPRRRRRRRRRLRPTTLARS